MRIVQWMTALAVVALALWGLSAGTKMYQARVRGLQAKESEKPLESLSIPEEEKEKLDYYKSNPFQFSKEGPQPKAVVAESDYFFDRMALNTVGEHEFVLKNEGDAPLKVAKGPTMCKCTNHSVKEQEVAPGEQITIPVKYEPKDPGLFSQTVTVWTNDPEHPEISLKISGNMFPIVGSSPGTGWVLGSIALNTPTELRGWIYSSVDPAFEVQEILPSSEAITVSVEPVPDDQLETLKLEHGFDAVRAFEIKGVLAGADVAGRIDETIAFKTNNAEVPEVKLGITGMRAGPFRIIGPGWYSGGTVLQMGRIQADQGKKARVTLMVDAFEGDLKFSNVVADPPFLGLKLFKESSSADSKYQRYTIEVEVPPGAPKGIWEGPRKGTIRFHTNHPKVPEYEFSVELENL